MKLNVERKPASLVVLDITADDDEFAEAMTTAYRKVSRDVLIPGFRKGKAPRSMIERFYGREVFLREAADGVMDTLYRKALEQENITPVGEPNVEINELEPVNFVVTVPVYPTIDVKDYATVRVDPQDAAVADDDIEDVLGRLQRSQSEWVDVEDGRTPTEGDQVTVDYEVMAGDEPFQDPVTDAQFVLGETNLLLQLREKLESMKIGETSSFDLAFAEDDDTADPSIRGKSLAYSVTLKDHKQRELTPLDDDFAMKVNETPTLAELRELIRSDIHSGKTNDARNAVVNEIINSMADQAEIDPPDVMVDEEVEHQLNHLKEDLQRSGTPFEGYLRLQDKTEADVRTDLRPESARRLRNSLFLQEVARKESVEVADEDIEAEINRMVGGATGTGDEADAQAARMAELYHSDYFKNMLKNQLFETTLTNRLIEIATEGKGAVTNAYVAPEPEIAVESASVADSSDESSAADESTTTGTPQNAMAGEGGADAPDGYPVKGNADSMIYHVPGGGSYDRTIAEFYFATPEDAEAAGYRPSAHAAGVAAAEAAGNLADAAADAVAAEEASDDTTEEVTLSNADDVPTPSTLSASNPAETDSTEANMAESKYGGSVAGDETNNVPEGFPIKGNDSSKIYHVPGGGSYDNTIAEYYFATEADAEAAGFRAAKR